MSDEAPKDACAKHAKKPGHFWSSCPECHKTRMKYWAKLRQKGEHPEKAIVGNATSEAIHNVRK